jgi:hypothetical protein
VVTLDALGNIGDFVGGIGVIITLLYLAAQIRQNSRTVKAASGQAILATLGQTLQSVSATPQMARVVAIGQVDIDQLTEDEQPQFILWLLGWFRILEQAFYQYKLGSLDPVLWEGHAAQISSTLQSPGVRRWWAVRGQLFHPEFRRFIDEFPSTASVPNAADVLRAVKGDSPPAA